MFWRFIIITITIFVSTLGDFIIKCIIFRIQDHFNLIYLIENGFYLGALFSSAFSFIVFKNKPMFSIFEENNQIWNIPNCELNYGIRSMDDVMPRQCPSLKCL